MNITIYSRNLEDEIKKLNDQGYTVESSKQNPADKKMITLSARPTSPSLVVYNESFKAKKDSVLKKHANIFDFVKKKSV